MDSSSQTKRDGRSGEFCLGSEQFSNFTCSYQKSNWVFHLEPRSKAIASFVTFWRHQTMMIIQSRDDDFIPKEVREPPREKLKS